MADRYKLLDDKFINYLGKRLYRVLWLADDREGGWMSLDAVLPQDGRAVLYGDVKIIDGVFWGGVFCDGVFWGGEFRGGVFWGGEFRGGVFWGGEFCDGVFWGGVFRGGVFCDGVFWGGVFWGGVFWGGEFRGGEFYQSPCTAQRSDGYTFVAKFVDGKLRVWAGCRNFSWDEAVTHWHDGHRLGAESQRIIHFLKSQAEAEEARNKERV